MAIINEVEYSELMGTQRLDAEYYDPALLELERAVKSFRGGWAPLSELTDLITDGDHLKRNYVEEGILFLTSENFQKYFIDYRSDYFISREYEKTLTRARAEKDAVFLTKTGKWYGNAVICKSSKQQFNISADVAKIRLLPEYDPYFLACYLNSDFGYALVRRESTGGSRDRIILDNLRTLPVPKIRRTENKFREIVDKIEATFDKANRVYAEGEDIYEKSLNLESVKKISTTFSEISFSEISKSKRFDAEYFSPRVQKIIEVLSRDKLKISNVSIPSRNRFEANKVKKIDYIEIGDISESGAAVNHSLNSEDAPSRATWVVKTNDVITSLVRPVRRLTAIIEKTQDGSICSSGFSVLTPKNIPAEILLVYLRLPLVCELMNIYTTSSMYPAISNDDLLNIPFSFPEKNKIEKIVLKVRESFLVRKELKQLYIEAKKLVSNTILGRG